jgi:hypothetical protein
VNVRAAVRAAAVVTIVAVTAVMWSDEAIGWSNSIIEDLRGAGEGAATVLEHRPKGDLDLHVSSWALVGALSAASFRGRRARWAALAAVLAWSATVESLQPVFTQIRTFQRGDLVGNALGVALVAVATGLVHMRTRRRVA